MKMNGCVYSKGPAHRLPRRLNTGENYHRLRESTNSRKQLHGPDVSLWRVGQQTIGRVNISLFREPLTVLAI
jgi:hypothetical protein